MHPTIMLFTRDLRIHDNPALHRAARTGAPVVPLFVFDDALGAARTANRTRFLVESLRDLRGSLRRLGADLVVRRGPVVDRTIDLARRVGAATIHLADDRTPVAMTRLDRLRRAAARHRIEVWPAPGPTIVPPGAVTPSGGDHYRVFTPYWRAWTNVSWRDSVATPPRLRLPEGVEPGPIPEPADLVPDMTAASTTTPPGGETAGRALADAWVDDRLGTYGDHHDDLAGDRTSHLSAHLHFGCVSPLELAREARGRPGGDAFVRQLCWRDFHHQVTAVFPSIADTDYRPRGDRWRDDPDALDAWRTGTTGIPIVDAGMRQLATEGWMHNRARLITASLLTRHLRIDWRVGAAHFMAHLVDADVANNHGNWQWVAGTGNDTRPNRLLNPHRQAERFDPDGDYVRRYVPELATVRGRAVHRPWDLPVAERGRLRYPAPIVDHEQVVAEHRQRSRR